MITTDRYGEFSEATRIVKALYQAPGIELGCGNAPHTRDLPEMTFADLITRQNPPGDMITMDILEAPERFSDKKFGVIYMLDVVEHLYRLPALKLLSELEKITERIVIFTPLGELWMEKETGPSGHHSAWLPSDFEAIGYTTWSWPIYHNFGEGKTHGAFWAWKDMGLNTPSVEMIAHAAEVEL